MNEKKEDILSDINATLEQLLQIAEALKLAKISGYFSHEVEALEKIEESLLARLMHRQSLLEMDQKKIRLNSIPHKIVKAYRVKKPTQKWANLRKAFSKSWG